MEPMSPGLPSMEILPQLAVTVIELSSTTTPVSMAALPPIPDYHPSASPIYEEDPSEKVTTTVSCAPDITGPSHTHQMEVISRHLCIIRTPYVPRE